MHEPMTKGELAEIKELNPADKRLIAIIVEDTVGPNDAELHTRALRGYLVSLFLDCPRDANFLAGVTGSAAAFADGWKYCMAYGVPKDYSISVVGTGEGRMN